jgi:hypothetical protein
MMKFIKIKDLTNPHDTDTITFESDIITLDDALESFECFLKACGFIFDGNLEIVKENRINND